MVYEVNPPPVSGSSSTGRRSFLKSLFFGSGGSSNSSQNRRDPISQLAHCQYFVPFEKETVRRRVWCQFTESQG
ncbi:hypothetical protein GCK32_019950 [Trichostrongylus colubriformis]|uniref:Uncharacterized protein n=1 Tax=Trichostrongylus colubriformis TaxID=6319 RepID=A0AAN8I8U3_TRICO